LLDRLPHRRRRFLQLRRVPPLLLLTMKVLLQDPMVLLLLLLLLSGMLFSDSSRMLFLVQLLLLQLVLLRLPSLLLIWLLSLGCCEAWMHSCLKDTFRPRPSFLVAGAAGGGRAFAIPISIHFFEANIRNLVEILNAVDNILKAETSCLRVGSIRRAIDGLHQSQTVIREAAHLLSSAKDPLQPPSEEEVEAGICPRVAVLPQDVVGTGLEVPTESSNCIGPCSGAVAHKIDLASSTMTLQPTCTHDPRVVKPVLIAVDQNRRVVASRPSKSARGHRKLHRVLRQRNLFDSHLLSRRAAGHLCRTPLQEDHGWRIKFVTRDGN